jgi:hypothetical protein
MKYPAHTVTVRVVPALLLLGGPRDRLKDSIPEDGTLASGNSSLHIAGNRARIRWWPHKDREPYFMLEIS